MQTVKIGRVLWPGLVGIGAGLVKNGAMLVDYCSRASSVEIGSITRHLEAGNPGKTVWKYPAEKSLRHNAGMPNYGIEHIIEDISRIEEKITIPWGINLAVTPGINDHQEAAIDIRETTHLLLLSGISPDWITLNVASPDTRDPVELLSEPERVKLLVNAMKTEMSRFDNPPLWLKVGPGMTNERLKALVEISEQMGIEALVCGNTYPDKRGGGWCGSIIRGPANAALWMVKQLAGDRIPLVGVGGILSGEDAQHKLDLGATAVQVVSATLINGRDAAGIIETELNSLLR